jgi:YD repeat-containing protein
LAVYDKDDNLIERFEYADGRMPVAMSDSSGNRDYLHYDQVGSLKAVTDTSHNIITEMVYDAYGNIVYNSNQSLTGSVVLGSWAD